MSGTCAFSLTKMESQWGLTWRDCPFLPPRHQQTPSPACLPLSFPAFQVRPTSNPLTSSSPKTQAKRTLTPPYSLSGLFTGHHSHAAWTRSCLCTYTVYFTCHPAPRHYSREGITVQCDTSLTCILTRLYSVVNSLKHTAAFTRYIPDAAQCQRKTSLQHLLNCCFNSKSTCTHTSLHGSSRILLSDSSSLSTGVRTRHEFVMLSFIVTKRS